MLESVFYIQPVWKHYSSMCELLVNDTVEGKTNLEEKTMEADHK
jgi:hypothetical protein